MSFLIYHIGVKMQKQTVLYTHKICPFAQRVWITLQEIKIPYSIRQVSFIDIQQSFGKIYKSSIAHDPNSQGKVPVLIQAGQAIAQSKLICWYLAQKYKNGHQLIPENAFERLNMRLFIQNFTKIIDLFYKFRGFHSKSKKEQERIVKTFNKTMEKFNSSLCLPYALGNEFTIADVLIFPWVVRWRYAQKETGIGIDKKLTKINEWLSNIQQRKSVKATMQPTQYYELGYTQYFATNAPIKSIPQDKLKAKL